MVKISHTLKFPINGGRRLEGEQFITCPLICMLMIPQEINQKDGTNISHSISPSVACHQR